MSCLGSWTLGVKDTPFFRFGTRREGGWETSTSGRNSSRLPIYVLASNKGTHGVYPGSGRPEAKSATPACLDEWFIMVWLTEVVAGVNPGGVG